MLNKNCLTDIEAFFFVSIVLAGFKEPRLAHVQAGQDQGVPAAQQWLLPHQLPHQRHGGVLPQDHHFTGQRLRGAAGQQEELHAGQRKPQCRTRWVDHRMLNHKSNYKIKFLWKYVELEDEMIHKHISSLLPRYQSLESNYLLFII